MSKINRYDEDEEEANLDISDRTLHNEKLGQIPVGTPLRWIDLDGDMPYENPEVEYIRSPYPLSLAVLASRWEGLWKTWQIEQAFVLNQWDMKRTLYQDGVNKLALEAYKTEDAAFQKNILKDDLRRMTKILERLEGDFTQGVEFQKVRGGGSFGYVKMPLTVESTAKLAHTMIAVSNLRATRVNIATNISREEKDIGPNLKDHLDNRRALNDPEYQKLLEIAQMGGRVFDSTPLEQVPVKDLSAAARELPNGNHIIEDEELAAIKRGVR